MAIGQGIRRISLAGGLVTVAAALFLAAPASGVQGNLSNPGIAPAGSKPYGKTYGQWAVAYWQWAMSIPIATNPWANDPTGEFAAIGQQGPVWFLGGSLGDSFTRDVTIPSNVSIFLPVHPWIFGATVFDCAPSVPEVSCDTPSLRASAAAAAEAVVSIEVVIDGRMVRNAAGYRALSPSTFDVTVPDDNIAAFFGADVPAGTYGPHVADGYYLMLRPLDSGAHTIWVHVVSSYGGGIEYDHVYDITVP